MKAFSALPLILFLMALGACKKPVLEVREKSIPPLILSTSIHDSLPLTAVNALQLSDVVGIKIKHHTGLYSNYFEYRADRDLLLETLSELPFVMQGTVADTQCHPISFEEMARIQEDLTTIEIENTSFFWTADASSIDVFECIKPPFRHTILVTKNSNRILHRIEFLGYS